MPKQKDFKRLVRGRMRKTGESYTSARAQLARKRQRSPADFPGLAGMSDDALRARTGRSWAEWVAALDAFGASGMTHRDIARRVHSDFEIGGWWAQCVTVGYERIRGLREIGQRRDGSHEASKSRTFNVPLKTVFGAFTNRRLRERWLDAPEPEIRKSTPGKSVRMTWHDGTPVQAYFVEKGASKCQVAIAHRKLASRADIDRCKTEWDGLLGRLAELLAERKA